MRSLDLPSLTFITSFPGPTLQANKLSLHQSRGTALPQCPPPGQIHKHVLCPKAAWLPLEVFPAASSVISHYLGSSDLFYSYSANLPISLVCLCFYKFHCQLIHLVLLWILVITTSRLSMSASKLWTKNTKQAEGLRADYCYPHKKI